MSDRARSSVRTEPRAGAGAPDEVPSGAVPGAGAQPADGERKGSSAVGAGGSVLSAKAPVAQPPSGQVPVAVAEKAPASPETTAPPEAKVAEGKAGQAPGKAGQAPAKAVQAPAEAGRAPAKAGVAAKAAEAPVGKAAQTPAAQNQAAAKAGKGATKAPAAGGAGAARGGVPAAGSVPVEATQAVTLPPAAAPPATGQSRAVEAPTSRPAGAVENPASRPAGAAESAASRPAAAGKPKGVARGPRRARLQLRHIDTWSALKISLVLSIALFFVWMVAVGILYGVLNGLGVFDSVNDLFGQLRSASGEEGPTGELVSAGTVFGGAAVIGAVNIVLLTALCTVTAFVYNLCSDLVGGLEVTLAERD